MLTRLFALMAALRLPAALRLAAFKRWSPDAPHFTELEARIHLGLPWCDKAHQQHRAARCWGPHQWERCNASGGAQ